MALRGTLTHRKTRRLGKLLGISPVFALGILEALWHVTAEQTPDGAIGKLSNLDISEEMFYDGDHDQLVDALIESGWIDRNETHRLVIHDWSESADTSVHTYLAKRTLLFCDGQRPRLSDHTLSGQTKVRIHAEYEEKYGHLQDTSLPIVRQESRQQSDNSLTNPVPDPDPVPVPDPEPKIKSADAQIVLEPVKTKNHEPKSKPTPWEKFLEIELPENLSTVEFREKWREFCVSRAENKHPLTGLACSGILAKLRNFEPDVGIQAMQNSINSGWRDVFPDKVLKDRQRSNGENRQKSVFEMARDLTARVASGN